MRMEKYVALGTMPPSATVWWSPSLASCLQTYRTAAYATDNGSYASFLARLGESIVWYAREHLRKIQERFTVLEFGVSSD